MSIPRLCPGVLKALPLFRTLTDDELAALLPSLKQRSYHARQFILRTGERTDGLYFILSGRVKILLEDGHGGELIVTTLGPNEVFGEMGLVDGGPRSATVEAYDACEVLFVAGKNLDECLQRNFTAVTSVLRTVVERLRTANQKIRDLALVDVYGRVANTLVDTCVKQEGEWIVEPGSEQIALMVGASREMVSRVLKEMIAAGLICRKRRKLVVLDREALAHSASVDHQWRLSGSASKARPGIRN